MGLFRKRRTPQRMGIIGEKQAGNAIAAYHKRNGKHFRWIRDYRYYTEKSSQQLDWLVINSCGIFVIEVKNWLGVVRGGFNDPTWEVVRRGARPHHYTNPIKQNISHMHGFKKHYKGQFPVYSLVVMASGNKPANVPGIRNIRELPQYFGEIKPAKISNAMIEQEYKYLISIRDKISDREHLRNTKLAEKAKFDSIKAHKKM